MADMAGMADGLTALSHFFVSDGTLGDTLTRVAELACQAGPADMAGLTMLVEGHARTGVFTDPEAVEIDEEQYRTGRGPCLEAFRAGQVFRIDSTDEDSRWPEFAKIAVDHGIHSTLSLPIMARGESLGALNLYARTPSAFDDDSAIRLEVFARQSAIVLVNAQAYWDARTLSENLDQAMRTRSTIEQAKGIIMAQGGRTPDEAFQLLVRASQRENRKLRDLANEIVDRTVHRNPPSRA